MSVLTDATTSLAANNLLSVGVNSAPPSPSPGKTQASHLYCYKLHAFFQLGDLRCIHNQPQKRKNRRVRLVFHLKSTSEIEIKPLLSLTKVGRTCLFKQVLEP